MSTPSMKIGRDGEKEITTFIVATNVIASRLPEHRPAGTPHARANYLKQRRMVRNSLYFIKGAAIYTMITREDS